MKSPLDWLSLLQRKKPRVAPTPADVVHRENKWSLLRYRARPEGRAFSAPVLLVPSMINRHYVLDLLPGKSFVEYLVKRGHDVFCIDWGTPTDEDRYVTFDDICDHAIGRALRVAAKVSSPEAPHKPHVLGYCMGGTLAVIHAAAHNDSMASLVAVAAPVRFSDDGLLSRWTRSPSFDVCALVDALGNVPWPLMQSAFHLLRPTLTLSKIAHLADRAWTDEFLDGFLATETWGNDNVAFPGECYRRYIEALYRGDQLIDGTFSLSGVRVDLRALTTPTLAVTFENDSIVPFESAGVLIDVIGAHDKRLLKVPGGHVGAMVS
ncbi:MAG: alpha/beta fold hydrolase, partial [Polyangiales bacterium]